MTPLLRAERIARVLPGEVPATLVRDVDLEVAHGEFIAITGPSGSGKSSLLYLLGLLDRPTQGRIELEGVDTGTLGDDSVSALRLAKLGFVFQSHFLLPEFSAEENVMLPMRRLGRLDDEQARAKARGLLDGFGLGDHRDKLPHQLSGGQRQRVAVARSLANDPVMVLADEPTGNLDTAASAIVQGILSDIATAAHRAVIVVTHDPAFAARATRRIVIVDGRISDRG